MLLTNSPTSVVILDLALICLEATLALAVLRYRLYDIDIVISRTVQYVNTRRLHRRGLPPVLVIGVGNCWPAMRASPLLAAVAAAVVAVAFEPAQVAGGDGWRTRLVYGHRATPYQVLLYFALQDRRRLLERRGAAADGPHRRRGHRCPTRLWSG